MGWSQGQEGPPSGPSSSPLPKGQVHFDLQGLGRELTPEERLEQYVRLD